MRNFLTLLEISMQIIRIPIDGNRTPLNLIDGNSIPIDNIVRNPILISFPFNQLPVIPKTTKPTNKPTTPTPSTAASTAWTRRFTITATRIGSTAEANTDGDELAPFSNKLGNPSSFALEKTLNFSIEESVKPSSSAFYNRPTFSMLLKTFPLL